MTNAKPAIFIDDDPQAAGVIFRRSDGIRAKLPELRAMIPAAIDLQIAGSFADDSRVATEVEEDAGYLCRAE